MSTETKATTRLLKDSDLAERWGIDLENLSTVHDVVREKQVPFLWIGKGEINLSRISWRCVRFRERDVEKWEGEQLHHTKDRAVAILPGDPDEKDLLGGKRPIRRYQV